MVRRDRHPSARRPSGPFRVATPPRNVIRTRAAPFPASWRLPVTSRIHRTGVAIALVALGILAAACGADTEVATATATATGTTTTLAPDLRPRTIVPVTLHEWSVVTEPGVAAPGPLLFQVANAGTLEHELVIVRTDLAAATLPIRDGIVDAEALEVAGEVEAMARGERVEAEFGLEAGAYVLLCNLPGHYEAGMRVAFTVR